MLLLLSVPTPFHVAGTRADLRLTSVSAVCVRLVHYFWGAYSCKCARRVPALTVTWSAAGVCVSLCHPPSPLGPYACDDETVRGRKGCVSRYRGRLPPVPLLQCGAPHPRLRYVRVNVCACTQFNRWKTIGSSSNVATATRVQSGR